jgi:hypothetical protein
LVAERNEPTEEVDYSVTPENLLRHLAALAYYDPRNLYNEAGERKHLKALDWATAIALVGVEGEVNAAVEVFKYRTANRLPALDLLGKYLKLFEGELKDKSALNELLDEFKRQYKYLIRKEGAEDAGDEETEPDA